MTDAGGAPQGAPPDLALELRRATDALARSGSGRGVTSDLSIDEALLLHSVGFEPVDLVCGVSVASVPAGVWTWGAGEIVTASQAQRLAFDGAEHRIAEECARVVGHGVVGVHVEVAVERHHVDVELVGTAVRPVGATGTPSVFVSDLSGRDFALLHQAGWAPVGLAAGASFVYAPRRSAGTSMRQTSQNVELTNYTEAMYSARELAMARMQQAALTMGGTGIVEVKVSEGPMAFARHAIGFTAWGTAVRLVADAHRHLAPRVVLPLDDAVVSFEAEALRGR